MSYKPIDGRAVKVHDNIQARKKEARKKESREEESRCTTSLEKKQYPGRKKEAREEEAAPRCIAQTQQQQKNILDIFLSLPA